MNLCAMPLRSSDEEHQANRDQMKKNARTNSESMLQFPRSNVNTDAVLVAELLVFWQCMAISHRFAIEKGRS